MLDHFLRDRAAAQRLRANPIGSHLDGFTAWLSRRGYAWTTIRQHVWALGAFGRWLHRRGRSVRDLRRRDASDFCRRRCAAHRRERDLAALRWFLEYLEAEHLIAATPLVIDRSPLAQLKDRYDAYLQRDRALSPLTITRHWFVLRRFLAERFGHGPIDLQGLRPDDVTRYLLRHVPAQSRFSTHVSMLRSFLRFLWHAGDIDRDLAAAIPPIRRWRLVDVPKYLPAAEVAHLLASVDRTSASGRRNYAILLLLARLGLRAGEVVRLELEDLDWHTGVLTVRGKGSVHAHLPLPRDVGAALVMYLRTDRPRCATRRVFVCLKAPHRGLGHSATVSTLVHCALNRAGLTPPTTGAHLLRHSLATDLLRHGSSLGDIGEVLRHRLAQTTEIYAKVDVDRLRTLAQPWPMPGGAR
jgi:site-specific recombinase XerD